jgi:hypothetical protein
VPCSSHKKKILLAVLWKSTRRFGRRQYKLQSSVRRASRRGFAVVVYKRQLITVLRCEFFSGKMDHLGADMDSVCPKCVLVTRQHFFSAV